jgi:hypothetical protein
MGMKAQQPPGKELIITRLVLLANGREVEVRGFGSNQADGKPKDPSDSNRGFVDVEIV